MSHRHLRYGINLRKGEALAAATLDGLALLKPDDFEDGGKMFASIVDEIEVRADQLVRADLQGTLDPDELSQLEVALIGGAASRLRAEERTALAATIVLMLEGTIDANTCLPDEDPELNTKRNMADVLKKARKAMRGKGAA